MIVTSIAASRILAFIAAGLLAFPAIAGMGTAHADAASSSIKVTLEVRNSLAVDLHGEPSSSGRVIKVGDPDEGCMTYVVLDG